MYILVIKIWNEGWSFTVFFCVVLCLPRKSRFVLCRISLWFSAGRFLPHMMTSLNGNISALLAICAGNSPVTGEFPAQRPVTRSFDFFNLRLNKRLSKQSWGLWFETPSGPLWRHYNASLSITSPAPKKSWYCVSARKPTLNDMPKLIYIYILCIYMYAVRIVEIVRN